MTFHFAIAYDMNICILIAALCSLLINHLNISRSVSCLMNLWGWSMLIDMMNDYHVSISICWSREFVRTYLWLNLLCKIMFLIY